MNSAVSLLPSHGFFRLMLHNGLISYLVSLAGILLMALSLHSSSGSRAGHCQALACSARCAYQCLSRMTWIVLLSGRHALNLLEWKLYMRLASDMSLTRCMLLQSYFIFSIGNITPIFQETYKVCLGINQKLCVWSQEYLAMVVWGLSISKWNC